MEHEGVIFTASRSKLYAFAATTGSQLWTLAIGSDKPLFASQPPFLKTSGGKLFVASRRTAAGGLLRCVDPATRNVLWMRETPAPINLHADAERLYVRSHSLGAYDLRSGTLLWSANVGGCGPLTLRNGRVYLTDPKGNHTLLALDARRGKPVWGHSTVASCGGIVINGGIALVSGNDGRLQALVLGGKTKAHGRQYM